MTREHCPDIRVTCEFASPCFCQGLFEIGAFLGAELVWRRRQAVHALQYFGRSLLSLDRPSPYGFEGFL